jgi:hypothetical protein
MMPTQLPVCPDLTSKARASSTTGRDEPWLTLPSPEPDHGTADASAEDEYLANQRCRPAPNRKI